MLGVLSGERDFKPTRGPGADGVVDRFPKMEYVKHFGEGGTRDSSSLARSLPREARDRDFVQSA